jgi:hypothetical protein
MSQFAGPPPKDPPPEDWPALYEAGATTTQIAAWTGHTLVRVVQHLRAAGVVLRPRGGPRTPGNSPVRPGAPVEPALGCPTSAMDTYKP